MGWVYRDLPESVQVPPCPHCRNRLRVARVAENVYVCSDCWPARPFVAVWQEEERNPAWARWERTG